MYGYALQADATKAQRPYQSRLKLAVVNHPVWFLASELGSSPGAASAFDEYYNSVDI